MPKQQKESTLARQWELLKILTKAQTNAKSEGSWSKSNELTQQLCELGYEVTLRTVQRDLQNLSLLFPIELNDINPRDFGWRWKKNAGIGFNSLDISEAIMLLLAERYLKNFMPQPMLGTLQNLFNEAHQRVEAYPTKSLNKPQAWLAKIFSVYPSLKRIPPSIDPMVYSAIYQGLYDGKILEAYYRRPHGEEAKLYYLLPKGLMIRGDSLYLIAATKSRPDAELFFALHRFISANLLDENFHEQPFDFNAFLAQQKGDFYTSADPIKLSFLCDSADLAHLVESPLGEDQTIVEQGDKFIVSVKVYYSRELRMFLRERINSLVVIEPKEIKDMMIADIVAAKSNYGID